MAKGKKASTGSYDATAASSYKCGWKLRHTSYEDGKRVYKVVSQYAWEALGFTPTMSLGEAKARAKQLNAEQSLDREKIRKAAARVITLDKEDSAYLPAIYVDEFTKTLFGRRNSSEAHRKKLASHWRKLTSIVKALKIQPQAYKQNQEQIYDYFIEHCTSLAYAEKLIQLLNRWGEFISSKQGFYYHAIEMPTGTDRSAIVDAYRNSDSFVGESDPLTPALLNTKRAKLPTMGNYEWLYISIWFGLRPEEINALTKKPHHSRITFNHALKIDVLEVYQSKLTSVVEEKRWKFIPAFLPEQKTALELIKAQKLTQPTYKTMHSLFGNNGHITLRAGRKGFIDLMLDHGQSLEDISAWLGHQNIEMTWQKYRNKKRVSFKPAG